MFRQGDVLIVPVKEIPDNTQPINMGSVKGVTTVMLGEATGHHHSFYEPVEFTEEQRTGKRFLRLVEPVALKHQEHSPITVPPGKYEIRRQSEFDDGVWRKVRD